MIKHKLNTFILCVVMSQTSILISGPKPHPSSVAFFSGCASACSLFSGIPQIFENVKNKSTQGVSMIQTWSDAISNLALVCVPLVSESSMHSATAPAIYALGDLVVLAQAAYYDGYPSESIREAKNMTPLKKGFIIATSIIVTQQIIAHSAQIDPLKFLSVTAGFFAIFSAFPQVVECYQSQTTEGVALSKSVADALGNLSLIYVYCAEGSFSAIMAPSVSILGDILILLQGKVYNNRHFWHEMIDHFGIIRSKCNCEENDPLLNKQQSLPLYVNNHGELQPSEKLLSN